MFEYILLEGEHGGPSVEQITAKSMSPSYSRKVWLALVATIIGPVISGRVLVLMVLDSLVSRAPATK